MSSSLTREQAGQARELLRNSQQSAQGYALRTYIAVKRDAALRALKHSGGDHASLAAARAAWAGYDDMWEDLFGEERMAIVRKPQA
jgi:hypothetical protein